MVPVGRFFRMGVIMGRCNADQNRTLKPLAWPIDQELLLTQEILELVRHLARRQMVLEGQVLAATLPKALRTRTVRFLLKGCGSSRMMDLEDILRSAETELLELGLAWMEGRMTLVTAEGRDNRDVAYELLQDPPWNLRPGAKRQLAVLDFLHAHGCVTLGQIKKHMVLDHRGGGHLQEVLSGLVRKGWVQQSSTAWSSQSWAMTGPEPEQAGECLESLNKQKPTTEQADALQSLEADLDRALREAQGLVRLVFGITGSGKTLLYLRLAQSALDKGRSVLLLAPEVALSAQLWAEVCKWFPNIPRHWYHGYLAAGAKLAVFRSLRHQSTPQIVVGTRSALFLPFANLGLIILDEEHDSSYKQEEGFCYQAKEVAYFRIRQNSGLLILGSATPDVKSYHAANQGEIAKVSLRNRVRRRPMPEICLVDMRPESRSVPLSKHCQEELVKTLERGEQSMLLLNRRGFAPLVSCLDCGTSPQCPRCEVGLTYHKGWERLLCHYCGHTQQFPCGCGKCGGTRFLPMGEGTEGLEEYLENLVIPKQSIVRLDKDSTRRKGRLEDILCTFAQGRAQIMVGTQMLSKGHHFPRVTLVVAVDGDIGLNLPDYRAAEKTFQLLVQLAGRAGRGERPGRVLIQTRNPEHPCWEHIRSADYEAFFVQELERRRKFAYPPFVKLGMIRFSYPREWERGADLVAAAGEHLHQEGARMGLRVLGPAPAPLSMLKGRKRFQCLLKARSWQDLRATFSTLHKILPHNAPLRVSLDLDPVNML
jgi:primosomal protein N' (replication factor Y) (superfamily II helicase)